MLAISRVLAFAPLGRILVGLGWLWSLRWKLPFDFEPSGDTVGLRTWLELEVEHPVVGIYGDLVDALVLPNFTLFAWLVFLAELVVGLGLVLGIGIRPLAVLGLLMSINLLIGLANVPGESALVYLVMIAAHLAVLLLPAASNLTVRNPRLAVA